MVRRLEGKIDVTGRKRRQSTGSPRSKAGQAELTLWYYVGNKILEEDSRLSRLSRLSLLRC